jgi:CD109 antigen
MWTTMVVDDGTTRTFTVPKTPDTITSWVLGGYAISTENGVGVSSTDELVVFQPFFIELKLPYSVIRGETFELVVAVYNYEDEATAVDVTLGLGAAATAGYTVNGGSSSEASVNCASVSKTAPCQVSFDVTPTKLGNILFDITGASATKRDVVQRSLLVKPEGIERQYVSSAFLEPVGAADGETAAASLTTLTGADGVVEGSVRLTFSATANLMAQSIQNLGSLVRVPTGCGEQNMITFAPIISVRRYFESTNTLSAEMQKKTTEYMKVGYQRELTYQRSDHGFSAFGDSDDASSLWLSAFVLRSFAQSAQILDDDGFYIDPSVLGNTATWIISLQTPNGEYNPSGLVLHDDMKGGVASNGAASLAAYVTLALLEVQASDAITDASTNSRINAAIAKTVDYLLKVVPSTAYSSALITYTLVKAGESDATSVAAMVTKVAPLWLKSSVPEEAPTNAWSYCYMTPSADVETVAYALLVLVEADELDDAYAASKWLAESRGTVLYFRHRFTLEDAIGSHACSREASRRVTNGIPFGCPLLLPVGTVTSCPNTKGATGGWQSTQDTVVALEALSVYAAAVYAAQDDILVTITGLDSFSEQVSLTAATFDLVQTVDVPAHVAPAALQVVASGKGKCVVSIQVDWNEPTPTDIAPPILIETLVVALASGGVKCEICATATAASKGTGMAIVQVQPFSGWSPSSMVSTRASNTLAKRVDNDGREGITFYLDEINTSPRCVSLELAQSYKVSGIKPVRVSASDYYEPAVRNDVLLSFDNQTAESDGTTIMKGLSEAEKPNGNPSDSAAMLATGNVQAMVLAVALALFLPH